MVDTMKAGEDESIEEKITYSAEDSIVALPEQGKVMLYGKAKVVYGENMTMVSEFMEVDYQKNLITAYGKTDSLGNISGSPEFDDRTEPLKAEKIMYNLKTRRGKIFKALTKQGELLVLGNEIKKDSNNVIYMKNMKCIPCQEEDARTVFRATRAKVIPNDKIVTGPMYLEIGGVPTPLGLPFGFFPNTKKQHNGILLPAYGMSETQGFNLRGGGFYWGINDKADLIFRGDIYTNGSWALNVTNDYNSLYKAKGNVYVGYKSFNLGDKDVPTSYSKQKAYEIRWSHSQDNRSNPSVGFNADVNYVNNQNTNRLNNQNPSQFLQNTFLSIIRYTKTNKFSSLSMNAAHSQNSQTGQMDITFPSLTFNVNRFFPFKRENAVKQNAFDKLGISYIVEAKNTLSGKEQSIFKGNLLDSMKNGIRHNMPISTNFNLFKYITVSPAINLTAYMYDKSIRKEYQDDVSPLGILRVKTMKRPAMAYDANFSTALNTQVYVDYLFKSGKIQQIRHLLIPTLAYTYRPDFGEEQYGIWKKVQQDSIGNMAYYSIYEKSAFLGPGLGKQNTVSLNLNNNLEAKLKQKTDTGYTTKKIVLLQNVSITSNYNFAADSFNLSDIALSGRTTIFKNLGVYFLAGFDPYVQKVGQTKRTNELYVNYDKRIARFKTGTIALNASLNNSMIEEFKKKKSKLKPESETKKTSRASDALPWSVTMSYNLSLVDLNNTRLQPTHALSMYVNLTPTKFWKVKITSGYDFNTQKMSYTSFNITRDLKCWEAGLNWVPFGINKSYSFTLNLKTSMLSDFKIPRNKQWFDNF